MYGNYKEFLNKKLNAIKESGLFKKEWLIAGVQSPKITLDSGNNLLNFCANNYLGLSSHPKVIQAAKDMLDKRGYGMSSVRFICGTQDIHKELENTVSDFLNTEDTILYAACFDANGGVFEPLLDEEDAIISDELNHASIIDGVRLCKAHRFRYKHSDMDDLELQLKNAYLCKHKMIVTDGVFSMDGDMAKLDEICNLAEKYDALVMVDDSHATGFIGKTGKGTHEHYNVMQRVDIITSTLGKALGGAMGGFTSGKKEIIEMLRQRSRPYLFSNSLAPPIVGAALQVFKMLRETTELKDRLWENTQYFRKRIIEEGFDIKPGNTPIVPIMLYDAKMAQEYARIMQQEGVFVTGFFYPVVPQGQARIRVQISAAHTIEQLEVAIRAFIKTKETIAVTVEK